MNLLTDVAIEWFIIFVAVFLVSCLILASIFDVRQEIFSKSAALNPPTRRRKRLHITILLYIDNVDSLETALQTIKKNHYKPYDIVVVDNDSSRTVRARTRKILIDYQTLPLYYYANRRQVTFDHAMRQGFKRSQRGDIVLLIASSHHIAPGSLEHLAQLFLANSDVTKSTMPILYPATLTIESTIRQLLVSGHQIIRKAQIFIAPKSSNQLEPATAVRREVLIAPTSKSHNYYDEMPLIYSVRTPLYGPQLYGIKTFGIIVIEIIFLSIVLKTMELAVGSAVNQPFLLLWAIVSIWVFISIILFKPQSFAKKIPTLLLTLASFYVITAAIVVHVVYKILFALKQSAKFRI